MFGVVGRPLESSPNWPMATGNEDRLLARHMVDYWASFAARGVPTAAGAPAWKPYGAAEYYLDIGAVPRLRRDAFPGMFELHEQIMQRRREVGEQWFGL